MKTTRRPVFALALGLAATLVLGACGGGAATGRAADIEFAQMMIPHHEQAVEMADLALARATSGPVAGLARQVKDAQGPEIRTMESWLKAWGASRSTDPGHSSHDDGMMSDQQMAGLEGLGGAAFDKEWLTMMIEHHEGAVTMAKDVLGTTEDAAVRSLAQAVVAGQEKEIATMRGLL